MSILDTLRGDNGQSWDRDPETLYQLISNARRRFVIRAVTDGEHTLDELATALARQEYGEPVTSTERKRVYIALYQAHIDKLTDAGVVEAVGRGRYDAGENHAVALDAIEAVEGVVRP